MKKVIAGAILAATLGFGLASVSSVAPASAQGIIISPDGVRVYPGDRDYDRRRRHRDWRHHDVDRRDAVRIAHRHGVGRVYDVDRRGRYWVVTGENRRGPGALRVRISERTGRVVDVDRVRRR